MKALVFNGIPKTDKGNTALILGPFVEGMREAGADVEVLFTRRLKIGPCLGESNCSIKHPGRCFQDDDMNSLLPKIWQADILVLMTPVYCDGMSGPLKNLVDRMLPFFTHESLGYEVRDGRTRLTLSREYPYKRVVLVSSCGLWELDNFDPMVAHLTAFCRHFDGEFAGALLRPHANLLTAMAEAGALDDAFEAARQAGRHLVTDGSLPEEALATVGRELISRDEYIQQVNAWLEQGRAQAATA